MPADTKLKGIKLQGTMLDRRRKLTEENKRDIRDYHRQGCSIHEISRVFGVSRRLVQFIVFPERQVKNLIDRAERGGSKQYYDKKKWKFVMRRHRAHKREIAGLPGKETV